MLPSGSSTRNQRLPSLPFSTLAGVFQPLAARYLRMPSAFSVFHAAWSGKAPNETEIQARIDKAVSKEIQDRMVLFEQKDRQFAQAYMAAVNLVRQ